MSACVRLEGVSKSFGGRLLFRIPEFEFRISEFHAVFGPNGAGKTTLLRLISGLERPDEGRVVVLGRDVGTLSSSELTSLRRRMGFAFQRPFLFDAAVRRNVEYPLAVRGVPAKERRRAAGEVMERLGLLHLADEPARALSAGEARRLCVARAAVHRPELLLLDEPFSNLDPEGAGLLSAFLRDFPSRGAAVILVTHALEKALELTSEVVRLEDRRLHRPGVENLMEGVVEDSPGGPVLRLDGGPDVAVVSGKRGPARAFVSPADVVVSLEPFDSSARNSLEATVKRLEERGDGAVLVETEAPPGLKALLTPGSAERMGLRPGREVVLTFKAAAVRVF